MNILFVVDKYYPENSANTVCANALIDCFKNHGIQVDILSVLSDNNGKNCFEYNGSKVIKLKTYQNTFVSKSQKLFKVNQWIELPWIVRKTVAISNRISHLSRFNTEHNSLDVVDYNGIYKQICDFVDYKYDVIISCSAPFALHVIASELLKRGIAKDWFPIFLDPFVNNKTAKKTRIKKRQKIAESVLSCANTIFMLDGIMAENVRMGFNPNYHKKVVEFTMPNLVKSHLIEGCTADSGAKVKMFYAGLFYKKIRNPKKMFEIINKMPSGYELNIYGTGCNKLVSKYTTLDDNKFKYWGVVEHDVCLQNLQASNILVNLSNTITNQMPSKVFEYVSYGKPIINFYFNDNDVSLKYLKKYPIAFNINVNSYTDEDVKNLIEFCEKNKDKYLNFDEATQFLSEYTADNVCEKIYKEITTKL